MTSFRCHPLHKGTALSILWQRPTSWRSGLSQRSALLSSKRSASNVPSITERSSIQLSSPPASAYAPSPAPSPPQRSRVRNIIYVSVFLALGLTTGTFVRWSFIPPAPFHRGSSGDELLLERVSAALESLPLVQELRDSPNVREWTAYSSLTAKERAHRLTSGPMGGSAGIAIQRVFWLEDEARAISVIWFGRGIAGWPGVVHGGALATVLDESLGRVALRSLPGKTGVTANLSLNYRNQTLTDDYCVIRVELVTGEMTGRKAKVRGTLETLNGEVCVQAEGLFVVPKTYGLQAIGDEF